MDMEYALQTWELSKQYEGKSGCRTITLRVPHGGVYGFIGPNGAGKSTFVRTMLGLLTPTGGRGEIFGRPIGTTASRQKVGYLPELFRYPDWLTGRQLLKAHADLCKLPSRQQRSRIDELLELVGLHGRGDEKIRGYSKGMQQRIGLASALLADPDLLFLDEPTSALDPIGRKEVRELMCRLRDEGKTIFLNSHLLSEVEPICDQVAIIHKGELVVQGDWRKLAVGQIQVEMTTQPISADIWKETPHVCKALLQSKTAERNVWLLTFDKAEDVPHVITWLAGRGVQMHAVVPREAHLEDVFMYWVKRKEAAHYGDDCPAYA